MGLSASQARLLSLTCRLTDNEYESQQITNAQLNLTSLQNDANTKYMEALNSNQLYYSTFDSNGNSYSQQLTHALMYEYAPSKNQYALMNTAGQILVSKTDAENFENTDNLTDFLACYNLVEYSEDYLDDKAAYEEELAVYQTEMATYNQDLAAYNYAMDNFEYNGQTMSYEEALKQYKEDYAQYLKDYQEYLNTPTDVVYDKFTNIVGTSDDPDSCYSNAISGYSWCYQHVLAHLLDFKGLTNLSSYYGQTYQSTVSNITAKTTTSLITGSAIYGDKLSDEFVDVSAEMDNEHYCDGDDDWNKDDKQNRLAGKTLDPENNAKDALEVLRSDYVATKGEDGKYTAKVDENGNYVLKTLKQKAIDLLAILQNSSLMSLISQDEVLETLINFTDGDMRNIAEKPTKPTIDPEPTPPVKPQEPTEPTAEFVVNDVEKSQWYTNLWYKMNGSDSPEIIQKHEETVIDEKTSSDATEVKYELEAMKKTSAGGQYYAVISDSLTSSSSWIQDALSQGIVTLERVSIDTTTSNTDGVANKRNLWEGVIYTNATDISTGEDETAQTIAEAEYEATMNEIDAKDKKYTRRIRQLETEHDALQKQYDSIKNAVSSNIQRTYKTFNS